METSLAESCLANVFASQPSIPLVEQTKGVKWQRCSRQASRYLRFFSFSCVRMTFLGSRCRYDLASVSVTWTSTMQLVPRAQKPLRRMSPRSSSPAGGEPVVPLVGQGLVFSAMRPVRIKGSSRIAEGVRAFPARCTNSSHISMCLKIMRPPFLQPRACCKVKLASQPSQVVGRSGEVMP